MDVIQITKELGVPMLIVIAIALFTAQFVWPFIANKIWPFLTAQIEDSRKDLALARREFIQTMEKTLTARDDDRKAFLDTLDANAKHADAVVETQHDMQRSLAELHVTTVAQLEEIKRNYEIMIDVRDQINAIETISRLKKIKIRTVGKGKRLRAQPGGLRK